MSRVVSRDGIHHGSVLYCSWGFTTHDRRFMAAAAAQGWTVFHARFDGGSSTLDGRAYPPGAQPSAWLGASEPITDFTAAPIADALAELINRTGADVVHAGPVPTIGRLAVEASPVPVVVMSWASDLLVDAMSSEVIRDHASAALSRASAVLVDCQTVANLAIDLGADADRVVVVPWGVDLELSTPAPFPPFDGPIRLLSLRTLEPLYDPECLLRGVASTLVTCGRDSVRLTMAGSGSMADDLRVLSASLGIDQVVDWIGRIPEESVPDLLSQHHLHISTALSDGSSISLLQAMAGARPSVVTDIPANREWVDDGVNGWVFRPGDSGHLAEVLAEALYRRDGLPAMGVLARQLADQRADWSTNSLVLGDLYRSVMRGTSQF